MRIEIHKDQSCPDVYLATHGSNGAILGTGQTPETALANILKSVRLAYLNNIGPAQADTLQKCIDRLQHI